jgi:phospholipid/cholesterol/gamma-HCH transport system substrate-binding protein
MKISNEVKVGAVALVTIIAFIWLFNFLKGKNYFSKSVSYYSVYQDVGGLAESSPVEINGYKVGVVQSINFLDDQSGRLLVEFSVNREFQLPVNSIAEIAPVSIIAGMKVQFLFGGGPGFYSEGDTIPGQLAESILSKVENQLTPVTERISGLLNVIDSVLLSVDDIMNQEFRDDVRATMANISSTTGTLDRVLVSKEKELKDAVESLSSFSKMLAENESKLSGTFSNLENITDTLAAADLHKTVLNLKTSLENAAQMIGNMNEGKGSAGKLLTNDSLYTNLSASLESLNELLTDMKANPKRYVHFSLFGKKNIPSDN